MLVDIKEDYRNLAAIPVKGLYEQNSPTKAGMFNHADLPRRAACVILPGKNSISNILSNFRILAEQF
jgi:hypothetical protein